MASVSSLRSFEYLEQLPETTFKRLYEQPSSTLAVFRRFLPHLAKAFVMAILFLPSPLPVAQLEEWVRPDSQRQRDRALDILARLHIFSTVRDPGKPAAYRLTNPFAISLQQALVGGGNSQSFGVPCHTQDKEKVDIDFLDEFARKQWEGILYYIVGSAGFANQNDAHTGDDVSTISLGTRTLLENGNLVEMRGKRPTITAEGFTFLLQDVNLQVWHLLIVYLGHAEDLQMDDVDVLAFLFTLGSLDVGQDYSTASLTDTQKKMLEDLNDFGIVYRHRHDETRFYPTRLATTLTSDSAGLKSSSMSNANSLSTISSSTSDQKGFIVVETNYRIYAYTSSKLQISILNLFTKWTARFPNMVAGKLTRLSIQNAVKLGITSQQIISYLTAHAHPIMTQGSRSTNPGAADSGLQHPILPPTVVDQIRLWQLQGDRMQATSGYLFRDFTDRGEYDACVRYADEVGVLAWKSDEKRFFFATRHEQIKNFLLNRSRTDRK